MSNLPLSTCVGWGRNEMKTKVVTIRGEEFFTPIEIYDLYIMYQAVRDHHARTEIGVRTAEGFAGQPVDLRKIDADRTFGDVIVERFSTPPLKSKPPSAA